MSSSAPAAETHHFLVRIQNESAVFSVTLQEPVDGSDKQVQISNDNASIGSIVVLETLKDTLQNLVNATENSEDAFAPENIETTLLNHLKSGLQQCIADADETDIIVTVSTNNQSDTQDDPAESQDQSTNSEEAEEEETALEKAPRTQQELYESAVSWPPSESESFESILKEILKDNQKPVADVRTWQLVAFRLAEASNKCISSLRTSHGSTALDAKICEYCKFHERDECLPARSVSECMTRFLVLNELMKE